MLPPSHAITGTSSSHSSAKNLVNKWSQIQHTVDSVPKLYHKREPRSSQAYCCLRCCVEKWCKFSSVFLPQVSSLELLQRERERAIECVCVCVRVRERERERGIHTRGRWHWHTYMYIYVYVSHPPRYVGKYHTCSKTTPPPPLCRYHCCGRIYYTRIKNGYGGWLSFWRWRRKELGEHDVYITRCVYTCCTTVLMLKYDWFKHDWC